MSMDVAERVALLREKLNSSGMEFTYMSLSDNDLRRYIVAHKKVDSAYNKIVGTNKWRKEFGVAEITLLTPGVSRVKNTTGDKIGRLLEPRDKKNRPIGYVLARHHNYKQRNIEDWTQFMVFWMEQGVAKCSDEGPDNVCVVADLKGFTMACMDYPLCKIGYGILQDHYPERLGILLVLNAPVIFAACWAILSSWLDENTASKIKFIKDEKELALYIDPSVLPQDMIES